MGSLLIRLIIMLLFLTPLVYSSIFLYPYISTKAAAIVFFIEILVLLVVWQWAFTKQKVRKPPCLLDIALAVMLFFWSISAWFGSSISLSLWSTIDRQTGLIFFFHLFLLYLIFTFVIKDKRDLLHLFWVCTAVGVVVSLVHIASLFDITLFLKASNSGSTLGNSTSLGTYLLFSFVFALILAFESTQTKTRRLAWGAVVLFALTVLLSQAMAAKLTLLGGGVLFLTLNALASKDSRKKRLGIVGMTLLVCSALFVIMSLLNQSSPISQWLIEQSGGARFALWRSSLEAFWDRPFLGWGWSNFQTALATHFDPCLGTPECNNELWFDKAHNQSLNMLIETGLLGFIAYMSVFIVAIRTLWMAKNNIAPNVLHAFILALAMFLVVQQFAFPDVVSLLLFITTLAAIRTYPYETTAPKPVTFPRIFKLGAASLATVFVPVTLFVFSIQPLLTNQATLRLGNRPPSEELHRETETILFGSPSGIHNLRVMIGSTFANWTWHMSHDQFLQQEKVVSALFDLHERALTSSLEETAIIPVYLSLARLYQAKARVISPDAFEEARAILMQAQTTFDIHPAIQIESAGLFIQEGKVEDAIKEMDRLVQVSPQNVSAQLKYLMVLKFTQDAARFEQKAQQVKMLFPQVSGYVESIRLADSQRDREALLATILN